jgi:predicted cobalt transporter CbtA
MRVGRDVKSGALAGLTAGLLLGLLLFFLAVPIIEAGDCYEQGSVPGCQIQAGMVPELQKNLAVIWGNLILGAILGAFFALVYGAIYPYVPGRTPRLKALVLGFMGFYVEPFLPNLAIPPRPPGVTYGGQVPAATADARLQWYGIFLATALAALILGFALYHFLVRRSPSRRTHMMAGPLSLAIIAGISAIPFAFFPAASFQPGGPDGLLSLLPAFTVISVGSWLAFWALVALLFGHLWTRAEARAGKAGAPEPA